LAKRYARHTPRPSYWVGFQGLYVRVYAWLLRRMPSERQRLLAVTILAGGLCGLAAVAFHLSIMGLEALFIDRANTASGHSWIWWTIVSPAIGGLVAGVA
jgi:H+/Cl- antiporter ClcA